MNKQEIKDFNEANKIVHKVEDEWHYKILLKYGFEPLDKEGVGFVRSYKYKKGDQTITYTTGVHADYWSGCGGWGYWASLEPHLKTLNTRL